MDDAHPSTINLPYDPQQLTALTRLLTVRLRRLKLDIELAEHRDTSDHCIEDYHRRYDALTQLKTSLVHATPAESLTITCTVPGSDATLLRDELFQLYNHVRPTDTNIGPDATLGELATALLGYAHRYDTETDSIPVPE